MDRTDRARHWAIPGAFALMIAASAQAADPARPQPTSSTPTPRAAVVQPPQPQPAQQPSTASVRSWQPAQQVRSYTPSSSAPAAVQVQAPSPASSQFTQVAPRSLW